MARAPRPPAADAATRQRIREGAEAALEHYTAYLAAVRNRSQYTLRNYRNDLGAFFAFLADSGVDFDHAGRSHGRAYLAGARDGGVAPASIKRHATTIRSFYGWLDREGMLPPAEPGHSILMLRYPKAPRLLPHFLSTDEAQALVDAP